MNRPTISRARGGPRVRAVKDTTSGIRAWLLDATITVTLIGGLALATALTSH